MNNAFVLIYMSHLFRRTTKSYGIDCGNSILMSIWDAKGSRSYTIELSRRETKQYREVMERQR